MLSDLIGKRFELSEVVEGDIGFTSLTFIGDDEVVRLETSLRLDDNGLEQIVASVEQLSDPVSDEVLTDVHCGNFLRAR